MNKQSILSLKKCALSFGVVMMAAGFTACSEKDMPAGPTDEETTEATVGSPVNVVNDPAELDKYVTNYKMPGSRGSRATKSQPDAPDWSMPTLPSTDGMAVVALPDWAASQDPANVYLSADGNENWVVPEGVTVKFNSWSGNSVYNLYIYGTMELQSLGSSQGANVYVCPGGKLTLTGKDWAGNVNGFLTDDKPSNLYIYDGGSYTGNYSSTSKTGLYIQGDANVGNATLGGKVYVGGQLTADALETNNCNFYAASVAADSWTFTNNSSVYVQSTIDIDNDATINAQNTLDCQHFLVGGDFYMENCSEFNAYNSLKVQGNMTNATQGIIYTPCLYVGETLKLTNSGSLNIPNHIYCKNFYAPASEFAVYMDGGALFEAEETVTIENKGWSIAFDNNADTPSAIVTKKFYVMEGQAAYISGYALLSAEEYWDKPSTNFQYYNGVESTAVNRDHYELQGTVSIVEDLSVNSKPEDCEPDFGEPETPPTPPTITELITSINHTHDTSATCVALDANGKPYFSWHKRGTSIHGCLEAGALDKTEDKFALTSWMEVEDGDTEGGDNWGGNSAVSGADEAEEHQGQFDYNHLIVANGQVVTVGDNATMGGFIGAIALDGNGDFGTNGTLQEAFKARQLLGAVEETVGRSGNCVLYSNGKYYIACAGGFQEYKGDINNLFTQEYYKNGNFKCWKAGLGDYELTAGSAKHIAINPDGKLIATLELTAKGSHLEDEDYWFNDTETAISAVLKVRDANNWIGANNWEVNIGDICPIYGKNAIAIDANGNVYVAAGKQGLLVYNNGNKVAGFSIAATDPHAGANGLAIDDKYVYVAYGIGGLYILNKQDLSVVSWYKSNAPESYTSEATVASANYVAVDGQYIYVAYGRHGIKILKLAE